jgi:hypothetical protein
VAEELMQTDLDLKSGVAILLVCSQIALFDERNGLVGRLGREDVTEGDVFEAEVLSDIIVVGDVDAGRDTSVC